MLARLLEVGERRRGGCRVGAQKALAADASGRRFPWRHSPITVAAAQAWKKPSPLPCFDSLEPGADLQRAILDGTVDFEGAILQAIRHTVKQSLAGRFIQLVVLKGLLCLDVRPAEGLQQCPARVWR